MFLDGDETFFADAGSNEDLNTVQKMHSTLNKDEHLFPRVIVKHGPSWISSDDNEDYDGRKRFSLQLSIIYK